MIASPAVFGNSSSRLSDWLLILVPGVIWGASFLFIAEGLEAMGPYGVAFTRILVGFAVLSLFPSARKSVPREAWGRLVLIGVFWMALPLTLFPFAEQRVSSAIAGMLNGAVPLFVALVAAILARKLPGRGIAIGLGVGLIGGVLMAVPAMGEGSSSAIGVLMVIAAIASYGIAVNVTRTVHHHGAIAVIWRAQMVALVLTAPLGLPQLVSAQWTAPSLLSMLALGGLGTGAAFVITTIASGRLGATRASAAAYLIPPVALLLGVLVRHEHVALLSVLGGAVCVAGAWQLRRAQGDSSGATRTGTTAPMIAALRESRDGRRYLTVSKATMVLALSLLPMSAAFAQQAEAPSSCAILLCHPSAPSFDDSSAAEDKEQVPARSSGPSFMIFRYASVSSLGMYSGYEAGPVLLVFGLLHNPRTEYEEVMVGGGRPVATPHGRTVLLAAAAYTSSGWYGQLYVVPQLTYGRLYVDITAQYSQPLESRGSRGVNISPGNALFTIGGGISAGAGYYAGFEDGSKPSQRIGPALRTAVPHGSATLEWVKGFAGVKDEVRLTLRSSF